MGLESAPGADKERKAQEEAIQKARERSDTVAGYEATAHNYYRSVTEKLLGRNKEIPEDVLHVEAKERDAQRERERADINFQMEKFCEIIRDENKEHRNAEGKYEGVAEAEISPGAILRVEYERDRGTWPTKVELNGMDLGWGGHFLEDSMEIQRKTVLEALRDYNDKRQTNFRGRVVDSATVGDGNYELNEAIRRGRIDVIDFEKDEKEKEAA